MRNKMKRVLSVILTILMVASVAAVNVSAANGEKYLDTFQMAMENQFGTEFEGEICKYYFYMPDDWKNEYNDYYDSAVGLDSCAAGIYWWNGFGTPATYGKYSKGWPGYAITKQDETCKNVFIAEIPNYNEGADGVNQIVFNNTIDGGEDKSLPIFDKAVQTGNIDVAGYDPGFDTYGFYPDGLETMENMIYVCNPAETKEIPGTIKLGYSGEWFYYYGNGEYGIAPTKEEAGDNVYSNGEFPPTGLVISETADSVGELGIGGTKKVTANKETADATSEDSSVATVEQTAPGEFVITGVAPGTTNIVFENYNDKTFKTETQTLPITVIAPTFDGSSISLQIGDEDYMLGFGIGENAEISYSNPGVATYDPATFTVKAVKCGSTLVTLKQGTSEINFEVVVGHKLTEKVTKKATCTAEGTKVATCACGYKKTTKIAKVAHVTTKSTKKATYFADGYKNRTTCKVCKKVISKGTTLKKLKLKTPKAKYTAGKRKLTVKYTKVSGATGFQVKYKIGKKTVTKTYSTKKSVSKTIKSLKKGTYKVYVRAFVKSGSKKAYSSWTKAKSVKVK